MKFLWGSLGSLRFKEAVKRRKIMKCGREVHVVDIASYTPSIHLNVITTL